MSLRTDPRGRELRGDVAIGARVGEVRLHRVVGDDREPVLVPATRRRSSTDDLHCGARLDPRRHERALRADVVLGALGRLEEARPVDAGVLHEHLRRELAAVAQAVLRLRDVVALDGELAVLDLRDALAELVVFRCISRARLRSSAKGTVVVAPSGSGSTMPCPEKRARLEDGDRTALEQAAGLVGEARHAKRVRLRVGHAAVGREEEDRLAGHAFREEHDHRRALVGDGGDGLRKIVARRARLDGDRRERAQVARRGNVLAAPAAAAATWAGDIAARVAGPRREQPPRPSRWRPPRPNPCFACRRRSSLLRPCKLAARRAHRPRPRGRIRPRRGIVGATGAAARPAGRRLLVQARLALRNVRNHLAHVGDGGPGRDDRRSQGRLERERRAGDERELHALPIFRRRDSERCPTPASRSRRRR